MLQPSVLCSYVVSSSVLSCLLRQVLRQFRRLYLLSGLLPVSLLGIVTGKVRASRIHAFSFRSLVWSVKKVKAVALRAEAFQGWAPVSVNLEDGQPPGANHPRAASCLAALTLREAGGMEGRK
jgi:hypothetical protein